LDTKKLPEKGEYSEVNSFFIQRDFGRDSTAPGVLHSETMIWMLRLRRKNENNGSTHIDFSKIRIQAAWQFF